MADNEESGYLIEFIQFGKQVKATAVDPKTMREVSTIVPANLPREEMIRLAVQKLEYVLNKES